MRRIMLFTIAWLAPFAGLPPVLSGQPAQVMDEIPTRPDTTVLSPASTVPSRPDTSSNAYIHEDWDYFAERLRNEFLALGEKQYRRGDYQSAVMDYYNFLYHFPDDDLLPLVHYRIGRSYEQLREFGLAAEQYRLVRDDNNADPRVKVVCLRQLARMDFETGDYQAVLSLPDIEDPYLLVLRGFASLTLDDWEQAGPLIRRAYEYYPARGRVLLDSLLSEIDRIPNLDYYRTWKRSSLGLLPGGGLFYLRQGGEGLGYAASVGSLGLSALLADGWYRYLLGAGAGGLYMWSFRAASREMAAANQDRLDRHLAGIRQTFPLDLFWSFAHPAIF